MSALSITLDKVNADKFALLVEAISWLAPALAAAILTQEVERICQVIAV